MDLAVKLVMDEHTALLPGLAYMPIGEFIDARGGSDDSSLFYAQAEHKF